jgi:hypothetical protein
MIKELNKTETNTGYLNSVTSIPMGTQYDKEVCTTREVTAKISDIHVN